MPVRVVIFKVNDAVCYLPISEAAALADRLHNASDGDIGDPAYGASVMLERHIDEQTVDETPEWRTEEKDAVRRVLEDWLAEPGGSSAFSPPLFALRNALLIERLDELPSGLYQFVIDLGNGKRDEITHLDRAPVPGQSVAFAGDSFIVDKIQAAPRSEFVALVYAHPHPG